MGAERHFGVKKTILLRQEIEYLFASNQSRRPTRAPRRIMTDFIKSLPFLKKKSDYAVALRPHMMVRGQAVTIVQMGNRRQYLT